MKEKDLIAFKAECKSFLSGYSLNDLRAYGRSLDMKSPTIPKKPELIEQITNIIIGTLTPEGRSKRGAPVLNKDVNEGIILGIEGIRTHYLGEDILKAGPKESYYDYRKQRREQLDNQRFTLEFHASTPEEVQRQKSKYTTCRGQLAIIADIPLLIRLDGTDSEEKIIVPIEEIRKNDLREGDVVVCEAKREGAHWVVTLVMSVNGVLYDSRVPTRKHFDKMQACAPNQKLSTYVDGEENSTVAKYLDWLAPIYMGQRGLILSAPKVGKTLFLAELVKAAKRANQSLKILGVLVGQPPENVGVFQELFEENDFLYTTYEDEPERQVFIANFALARAKRYVECGNNVLLVVDSITALARAFNDTDASIGDKTLDCGLERKTLQYVRLYLGAARSLVDGGTLTIVGLASKDTGNPADQLICAELCGIANYTLALNEKLAFSHIYPALDVCEIRTSVNEDEELKETQRIVRAKSEEYGAERLLDEVANAATFDDFKKNITK